MAINLNKDYNDETLLPVFYKIIRDNLDLIVDGLENAGEAAVAAQQTADSKLDSVPAAAIGKLGGIKPLTDGTGTVNRSGFVIGADGTTYISTKANGGIARDGAGQLHITDSGITTVKLASEAVTADKLSDGAVVTSKLVNGAVTATKLDDGAVTADKLAIDIIATKQEVLDNDGNHLITAQNAQWLNGEDYVRRFEEHMQTTHNIAGVRELTDWIDENVPQLNNLKTYSNKPQRIGTWIDGTPIWRIVVQQGISDINREDKSISVSFPVQDQTNLFIINEYMRIIYDSDVIVDDHKLSAIQGGMYDLPAWISTNTGYNKISGWIEFATPESNIRQYTGGGGTGGGTGGGIPDQEVPL